MTSLPADRFQVTLIDWYRFLDRPRLPVASNQCLDQLSQASILITGAGGSIGSALSLRLAALKPRNLALLDSSEQAIHQLGKSLSNAGFAENATIYLGSTHDLNLLDEIVNRHNPNLIFHAAAHKHVPLLEDHPLAAIHNNVFGTRTPAQRAQLQQSTPRIVLLSTDKASDPVSILGATKRLAESIILAQGGIALRLANVLGSEGSVVQSFLNAIERRLPLTITDPDAERYFLTLEEAVDLLLSSAFAADDGALLAPKLPGSNKIVALAEYLLSTYESKQSSTIQYSSLQPGEKLRETLWSNDEAASSSNVNGCLQLIGPPINPSKLEASLIRLESATQNRDHTQAIDILCDLVPGYNPSEKVSAGTRIDLARCKS